MELLQNAFMAMFLGLLYFHTKLNQIQTYMPNEFLLLVREYHDGNYLVLAYQLAKIGPIFGLLSLLSFERNFTNSFFTIIQ
ncbi:unnamed protein product [Angiostrongylus costaricensis]|uniref:Uncharacterized protein n=1 Tax=Angiostrongylus costaricensis TaxID=334426 RepID=A0A0R3PER3_ANGCS|nr:unnamed protein product [Angiostrongylus costaricensis]